MLRIYLISAFRNLKRNKLYAFINTLGLSLGLAISFVIFSWVAFELDYDKFHSDYDHIYRLVAGDETGSNAALSPAAKSTILNQIPEIESSTCFFKLGQLSARNKIVADNHVFTDNEVIYADDRFFDIFTFPAVKGNSDMVFLKTNAVAITQEVAVKYFGNDDPIGKSIIMRDSSYFEVVAVLKDIPVQSHFHFDIIASMKNHPWGDYVAEISLGSSWMFYTYAKLNATASPEFVVEKINEIGREKTALISPDYKIDFMLQPITDIHLKSSMEGEYEANNDIRYIYLFSVIAFLVIFMAGINYVNLTTAYSLARAKEVGVKKVLGAEKRQLVWQFLAESILTAFVAFILAAVLIDFLRPFIKSTTGYEYEPFHRNIKFIIYLAGLALATGIFSGLIPSFTLASIKPILTLKSKTHNRDDKGMLRKLLVVFQFCISLILIIVTLIMHQQFSFIKNKKLGYAKDHIMVLYTGYPGFNFDNLKAELLKNNDIADISGVSSLPSDIESNEYIDTPGDQAHWVYYMSADNDYFKAMDIPLRKGKENVENLLPENYQNKYVINRSALKEIGWDENQALGQEIVIRHGNMKPGPVIGIMEDFHFQSLHYPIRPLVLEFASNFHEYMLIKLKGQDLQAAVGDVQSGWEQTNGNIPFEYNFMDQAYNDLYKSEMLTSKLFIVFGALSIFIAMLGLFGLASFSAVKRTKEIGIRKVYGAGLANILIMLSSDFAKLVFISFVIAAPTSYYLIHIWLEDFAYRTDIDPVLIGLSGILVLLLALIAVAYHSISAARRNPVDILRNE